MNKLKVKVLREGAKLPVKAKEGDACFDVFASLDESIVVLPMQRVRIPFGIAVELPDEHWQIKVLGRSGNSGDGKLVHIGTVDYGYRGEVMANFINLAQHEIHIHDGYKIAQLDIQKVYEFEIEQVEELSDSERGSAGFGSTGV